MQLLLSVLFLILAAGLPIAYAAWVVCRGRLSLTQWLLLLTARLMVRFYWRCDRPDHLPLRDGEGAVFVCNHRSSIDPIFVQAMLTRPVHTMVAREYFAHPVFGWLLRHCEAIPVGRGGVDTAATKAAIRLAQQGELVSLFPEGRLNRTDQFMLPVRPGAILVASRARVPIIPCYLEGVPFDRQPWSPLLMPARVKLRVGEPIYLAEDDLDAQGQRDAMKLVAQEIASLAGIANYEPTFAGRRWLPTHDGQVGSTRPE